MHRLKQYFWKTSDVLANTVINLKNAIYWNSDASLWKCRWTVWLAELQGALEIPVFYKYNDNSQMQTENGEE